MEQRYCRKVKDAYVYPYSDALMGRGDFVECDVEGRRMDVKPPEAKSEVAGIDPGAEAVSEEGELRNKLKDMTKKEIQAYADDELGGAELNLQKNHDKVVDDAVELWLKRNG